MARRGKKIDFTSWVASINSFLPLSTGSTAALTFITAGSAASMIMRTRGNLVAFIDSTSAPGVLMDVGIGLIVMSEGQSTTVVSSPIADANAPWLYYSRFVVGHEEAVVDAIGYQGLLTYRETVDVKAMRIIRLDREVQCVVESVALGSVGGVNISLSARVLLGF